MTDRNPSNPGRTGYQGSPAYGRGYGRDFGGGGRNQGFDGSWARGYGGSMNSPDGGDRAWIDRLAEQRSGPHAGRGPRGWTRSDARLQEAVCEALMHDRLLDARGLEVRVEGGVVTLAGEVRGASDVRLAETLARRCPGVQDVRTELEVAGEPRRELRLEDEAPNPYHPPGQDHAVTASQRNAQLGQKT